MTYTNKNLLKPKSLKFSKVASLINLIVHGQGIFVFDVKDITQKCVFKIHNNNESNGLKVILTPSSVEIIKKPENKPLIDIKSRGLLDKKGVYYWISIDSQNRKLYAGIGEARMENVIYRYYFEITEENKQFLENLTHITISKKSAINPIRLIRDPVTMNVPMRIKDTDELTMTDIASNNYLPTAYLSPVSRKLYDCIAGKNFILNTKDFADFSDAIEYSIKTPGLWCYERLKQKSTEFNPDKPNLLETYLRITLGQNNGESPGIPYVMEIWPPHHYSPIHNHGGASAVIRVLHGKINVNLYPFLCDEKDTINPFGVEIFNKDEITWISPTLNQVHKLENTDDNTTCITIQCYMYENEDNAHYDYFDYLDDDGHKQQYEPDSDMDFIAFKETIKEEWSKVPESIKCENLKK